MSVRATTWVWEHSPTAGNERLLLLAIADIADDCGRAFPSVATLARKTKLHPRTCRRLINRLVGDGHLVVEHGGGRYANRYTLLFQDREGPETKTAVVASGMTDPAAATMSTPLAERHPWQNATGGTSPGQLGRNSATAGVTQLCHPNPHITLIDPSSDADQLDGPSTVASGGGGGSRRRGNPGSTAEGSSPDAAQPGTADVDIQRVLDVLAPVWKLGPRSQGRLRRPLARALADGWIASDLAAHLSANPEGAKNAYAVLNARLSDLPEASARASPLPPWCGRCDGPEVRWIERDDDRWIPCPECSRQVVDTQPTRATGT